MWFAWLLLVPFASAVGPRWSWVESSDNVEGGDWYRDQNDDYGPYLAGSEAYVMKSFAEMYRATGDPTWLDSLAWHADGVLAQRNDARGVTDFTGVATPCWRDMYYTGGRPFCWVIHDGTIIEPIAEFAQLVYANGLEEEIAYDGTTFGEKAAGFVTAAEETVAFHEVEWVDSGWYIIRGDATFLDDEAGNPYPLNCSNAMGAALVLLYDVTGNPDYLDKITALAGYFRDNLVQRSGGGYVWPYYGDDVTELGEDIAHASVSVRFAAMCHERGIVFTDEHMQGMVDTLANIVVDDRTFSRTLVQVDGDNNYLDYESSLYEWLPMTSYDPAVYTAVRNLWELSYAPADNTSGVRLEGWAQLALHEPASCRGELVSGDWTDVGDDWWEANSESASFQLTPPDAAGCMVPMEVDAPAAVEILDGADVVARWQATGGAIVRYLPAAGGGPLTLTFTTDTSLGALRVRQPAAPVYPAITSAPPANGASGATLAWTATGEGDAPVWWSLTEFPTGARIDPASGGITWTPPADGAWPFTVRLETDWGEASLAFDWCSGDCPDPVDTGQDTAPDSAGETAGDSADTGAPAPDTAARPHLTSDPALPTFTGGCGCAATPTPGGMGALALIATLGWRRRGPRGWAGLVLAGTTIGVALLGGCVRTSHLTPNPPRVVGGTSSGDSAGDTDGHSATDSPLETAVDSETGVLPSPDADADGSPDGDDCAPDDPAIHPGQADTCDGVDVDCDGLLDEDCAVAVAAGESHSCALLADGRVVCWGAGDLGQLDVPALTFASVDAGFHHSCGVTGDGTLACWGEDSDGQATPPAGTYTSVAAGWRASVGVSGGLVHFWGSPYQGLALTPTGDDWSTTSCGRYHCCAVSTSGEGECWGYWGLNTVPADATFSKIASGYTHNCALLSDGTVTCWGYGDDGRREPPETDAFIDLDCGAVHCCGLHEDGTVACWGGDEAGQTDPPEGEVFTAVATGGYHTCGVTPHGGVVCWGNDAQGECTVPDGF